MDIGLEQRMQEAASLPRIYFDHAATTAPRPEVTQIVMSVLTDSYGNPSSFYKEGHQAACILAEARATIANGLQVLPEEVFFTSCGTESDNWAIKGVAHARQGKGRHLITSNIEHHAVLHTMQALEKEGFEVTYLKVDETGLVDPEAVRSAIRPDTILVSIIMANNEIGTLEPIREIGQVCDDAHVLFHSDAVQALGAVPVHPRDLKCDLMSFSGHKLYAPKGIGVLYKRKGLRIERLMDGGAQEGKQRGGTENVAYAAALAKAFELALETLEQEAQRQILLRDRLIQGVIQGVAHTKLNGHPVRRLPNNANFSFEFIEGESILLLLDALGYACSSGSACTSASLDPSHVLLGIGMPAEIAHGSLRITIGRETTDQDIDRFLV
ncbi:MAG TPA: aminotransferase class V-fold PLP-dependent enzyme, partial [Clostridia bacterium]|nr:aminotransferase class V-fold PLP-dependent enzyme [Clostridia bacterium]